MSRLAARFAELRAAGRAALVPFVTAGDPVPEATVPVLRALVEAGADVLELGVPFSDPMADGPVIQRASERALAAGMTLDRVLSLVEEFRRGDAATPVVLMGYLNPIEVRGYERFCAAAAAAGVDGLLVVDLPPEEAGDLHEAARSAGLDLVFLVAPTSDDARIRRIAGLGGGYLYYVSLKGVTGSAALDPAAVAERVRHVKAFTDLPVGVGFGIGDPEAAAAVARVADAVIVGSVLVRRVEALADRPQALPASLAALLGEMRRAMDEATAPPGGGPR